MAVSRLNCGISRAQRLKRLARTVGLLLTFDGISWWLAVPAALTARYGFSPTAAELHDGAAIAVIASLLQVLFAITVTLRSGRRHVGSFGDIVSIASAAGLTTAMLFALNAPMSRRLVPLTVPVIAGAIALVLQLAVRGARRYVLDARNRPDATSAERVIVFGAGDAGSQIVRSMLSTRTSPFLPVAILDDDHSKHDLRVVGVPVVGGREQLAEAAERFGATVLVVAIPSAHGDLLLELSVKALGAGLTMQVVPTLAQLVGGTVHLADIRPVTEADLLGRHEIDTDMHLVAGYLTGRRVLVTGAGGSIGSELCRQLALFKPAALVMLDRDESALHAVQLSLHDRAVLDDPNLVVADIRDTERMREVFQRHLPDVVFHAAALKHVTLLEMHPTEAVQTNVIGTQNVLDAAVASGVRTFVNISTDKAANAVNVLGYTKRIAERLTAAVRIEGSSYLSVRFGNVLGSRGSVLTTFRHQIDAGGPVTVTHPDVTRFFMTVEEAVQLTIQAGGIGASGEVLVLDMGEPVRIAEVAQRLIEAAGKRIAIEYVGLKPGEKLHEELFGDGESDLRPRHPQISQVPVPPLRPRDVWSVGEPVGSVADRLPQITVAAPASHTT